MSPPQQQEQEKPDLPRATVASAVASLTKWIRKRAADAPPNLLADERNDLVVLQLSLRRVQAKPTTKPHLLPLPHPVIAHSAASVCIISDDRAGSGSPAAAILDAARSLKLPVSEVVPFSAIRTDYRPYESRRRFAASYELFLADRALLPMLPRLLGKSFYSTKKAPLAVDFARAGWPEQVRKILSSTFLYLRTGTCSGVKVARLDMEEEEIVENVIAAVEAAIEKVPKKWANVRALHLKAVDSVSLPLYQVVRELGLKIEVPRRLEGGIGAGGVIDAAEMETSGKHKGKKTKGLKNAEGAKGEKKRALDTEVEDVSPAEKKGKKSEHALKEAGSKKSKGEKEDSKQAPEEVEDVGSKRSKGKKGEVKEGKKKSLKGDSDDGEILVDGPDTIEQKKSKRKKLSDDKIRKEPGQGFPVVDLLN